MIFYWVCTHQVCTHQVYLGFTEVGLNKFHGHHFSVLNHHFCYTKHGRRLGVSPVPGQTQFHIAGYTQFIYIYLYIYVSIHINYVCNRHIRTNIDVSYFPITSHYVMIAYTRYIRHLTKKQRVTLVSQASSRSLDAMATLAEQLLSQGCDESGRHSSGVSASLSWACECM